MAFSLQYAFQNMSFFSITINVIIEQSFSLDSGADVSERTPRWLRRVCCEGSVTLFLFSGVRPDFGADSEPRS